MAKDTQNYAKLKGNYQTRVHSDQMVLMIVRQEAGSDEWWPNEAHEKADKQL
jgi:hypothetical protein